jgi:hypothetical protein
VSLASEYGSLKKTYTSTASNPCFIAITAAFSAVAAALALAPRPVSKLAKPRIIRAWIGANAFHVARHDPIAMALVDSGASVAQVAAIWRGSGRGGNPENEEERVQADLDPSAPKRRQGKGSGGGDKVEQENEGEGGLVAVRESVKPV